MGAGNTKTHYKQDAAEAWTVYRLQKLSVDNGTAITDNVEEKLSDFINHCEDKGIVKDFDKSAYKHCIDYIVGNALDVIPELDHIWDLVFIDADKENYSNYFELVIDKVRKGGFIIVDNVLWSGKVVGEIADSDKETQGIVSFNSKVNADQRVENVLFPVRDGLMVLRKL